MFKLLLILVSLISFQVNSEELKNFKIEGFGLGQNLIDFFSEKQIRQFYEPKYSEFIKDKKYIFVEFTSKNFKVYDNLIMSVSNDFDVSKYLSTNNKKFKIISIQGLEFSNIETCMKKKMSIENDFDSGFKHKRKESNTRQHPSDKSGKSLVYYVSYIFQNGQRLRLSCYDWSEEMTNLHDFRDHLRVNLMTKSYIDWYKFK